MSDRPPEKSKVSARRVLREYVFKIVFCIDFGNKNPISEIDDIISSISEEERNNPILYQKELLHYVEGIYEHLDTIDQIIKENLNNWSWERLMSVDKNILRLATFELLYEVEVPVEVTLNEAVEMAKDYGSEKSSKFVNGVLDVIAKKCASEEKKAL